MNTPNTEFDHDPSPFQEEWLSAYLDDELTPEQRQLVELRLESDPAAQMLLSDLERIRGLVSKLSPWAEAVPPWSSDTPLPPEVAEESADSSGPPSHNSTFHLDAADVEATLQGEATPLELTTTAKHRRASASAGRRTWWKPLVMAAGVLVMVGIGASLWQVDPPMAGLATSRSATDSQENSPEPAMQDPVSSADPAASASRMSDAVSPTAEAGEAPPTTSSAESRRARDAAAPSATSATEAAAAKATIPSDDAFGALGGAVSEGAPNVSAGMGGAGMGGAGMGGAGRLENNFADQARQGFELAPNRPEVLADGQAAGRSAPEVALRNQMELQPEALSVPALAAPVAANAGSLSRYYQTLSELELQQLPARDTSRGGQLQIARSQAWSEADVAQALVRLTPTLGLQSSEALTLGANRAAPVPLGIVSWQTPTDVRSGNASSNLLARSGEAMGETQSSQSLEAAAEDKDQLDLASPAAPSDQPPPAEDAKVAATSEIAYFVTRQQAELIIEQLQQAGGSIQPMWLQSSDDAANGVAPQQPVVLLVKPQ